MRSATSPRPTPRTAWLKATEDMFVEPRATSPKMAEAKANPPPTTRMPIRSAKVLSMRSTPLMSWKVAGQCHDDTEECKNDREHPVAHDDLVARPADGFEMVVQGRDAQELHAEISLGYDLRDVGAY